MDGNGHSNLTSGYQYFSPPLNIDLEKYGSFANSPPVSPAHSSKENSTPSTPTTSPWRQVPPSMELQKAAHTGEQQFSGPLYGRDVSEVIQPQRATPFNLDDFLQNQIRDLSCPAMAKLAKKALEKWVPTASSPYTDLPMLKSMNTLLLQQRSPENPQIPNISLPDNPLLASIIREAGCNQQMTQVIHGNCTMQWTTTFGAINNNGEVSRRVVNASGYFDAFGFHSTSHQESSTSDKTSLPPAEKEIANLPNQKRIWVAYQIVSHYCASRPSHQIPETAELIDLITTITAEELTLRHFRAKIDKGTWHYSDIGMNPKHDSSPNGLTPHQKFCHLKRLIPEWDESKTDDFFISKTSSVNLTDTINSLVFFFARDFFNANTNGTESFDTSTCKTRLQALRRCFTFSDIDHASQSEMTRIQGNIEQWAYHFEKNPPQDRDAFVTKLMGVCEFMTRPIDGRIKASVASKIADLAGFVD